MKFFLNGAETNHQRDCLLKAESKYIVFNYNILKRSSHTKIQETFDLCKEKKCKILLEAGSYNFQQKILGQNSSVIQSEYQKAFLDYKVFVERYKYYIDMFSTIDIEDRKYNNFQKTFIEEYAEIGRPFIFTPTLCFIRKENWEDISKYKNIVLGIQTGTTKQDILNTMRIHRNFFRQNKVRFHAWSLSNSKDLKNTALYSATTPSWSYGGKYGTVYKYVGRFKLERIVDKHHSKAEQRKTMSRLKRNVTQIGLDFELFKEKEAVTLNTWNAFQFVKLQKHLDSKKNEYFNMDKTKNKSNILVREPSDSTSITTKEDSSADQSFVDKVKDDPINSIYRLCDTCEYQDACPKFKELAQCAFEFTWEIQETDLQGMHTQLIKMQYEIIRHKQLGAKIGAIEYADLENSIQNVSKMIKTQKDMQKSGYNITLNSPNSEINILQSLFESASLPATRTQHPSNRVAKTKGEERVLIEMREESKKEIESDIEDAEIIE